MTEEEGLSLLQRVRWVLRGWRDDEERSDLVSEVVLSCLEHAQATGETPTWIMIRRRSVDAQRKMLGRYGRASHEARRHERNAKPLHEIIVSQTVRHNRSRGGPPREQIHVSHRDTPEALLLAREYVIELTTPLEGDGHSAPPLTSDRTWRKGQNGNGARLNQRSCESLRAGERVTSPAMFAARWG